MWNRIHLPAYDTIPQVEDGDDATGKSPEPVPRVPGAARRLDDGMQGTLVRLDPDMNQFDGPRLDRSALHDQFDRRVANLALGVRPVAYAD